MNQTVAVTGATGFIGKYIIDNLLARGFHVRALTRTARAHVNDNLACCHDLVHQIHSSLSCTSPILRKQWVSG